MILVGDIGGTKTRLALSPFGAPLTELSYEAIYASSQYKNLEDLVLEYLDSTACAVEVAVFGVAGPVVDGRVKLTNLPWVLDQDHLAKDLKLKRVVLVNDLVATAAAIPHLHESSLLTLNKGESISGGNRAVIAPGTGLGEAFMVRRGDRWQVCATEGGHTDFAPRDEQEQALLQELQKETGRVSCETVCAGPGITRIYRHLRKRYPQEESLRLREILAGGVEDPVPPIVGEAVNPEEASPLSVRTLRFYTSVLAAEAGNLALKVMSTGGIYLGGGIPPRILPFLREEGFLRSFMAKEPMSDLMVRMPIHVILEPRAALLGAACWFQENENT
ncbi:MAG: glucokinase [Syntrophaceae bacterium]|nr:glucokinase [Syntrophaceae bacterium]